MTRTLAVAGITWLWLLGTLVAQDPPTGLEDVITVQGSQGPLDRKGTIVDWQGELLIFRSNEREREVDPSELVAIKTRWPESLAGARRQMQQGATREALESFRQALEAETRTWARRAIAAQMVSAWMLLDEPQAAMAQYRTVVLGDPHTRFLRLAPLPWTNSSRPPGDVAGWMDEPVPILQLLGASWSLQGPQAARARQVIESLANDLDPRVRALATAQSWRLRTGVPARQLVAWQELVDQMPATAGGGPRFVLAELQAREGDLEAALLNWMQVIEWHADEAPLVAASLYRAEKLARQQNQPEVAARLRDELQRRFPESLWAQQLSPQ